MPEAQAQVRRKRGRRHRARIGQEQFLALHREQLRDAATIHLYARKVDVIRRYIEQGGIAQQQVARIRTAIEDLEAVQIGSYGQRIDASEIEPLVDRRTFSSRRTHRLVPQQVILEPGGGEDRDFNSHQALRHGDGQQVAQRHHIAGDDPGRVADAALLRHGAAGTRGQQAQCTQHQPLHSDCPGASRMLAWLRSRRRFWLVARLDSAVR